MGGEEWEEGEDEPYVVLGEVLLFNNNIIIIIIMFLWHLCPVIAFSLFNKYFHDHHHDFHHHGQVVSSENGDHAFTIQRQVSRVVSCPDNREILRSNVIVAF